MFAAISRDDAKWSGSGNADKEVEDLNCVPAFSIAFGLVVAGVKAVAMLKKPAKNRVEARIFRLLFWFKSTFSSAYLRNGGELNGDGIFVFERLTQNCSQL